MKTEAVGEEDKRYIYNSKPEIDEFWNDCLEQRDKKQNSKNKHNSNSKTKNNQEFKSNNISNNHYHLTQYSPSKGRNTNPNINKNSNIRTYNSVKLFNPKNKSNNNLNSPKYNINNNKKNSSTEKYLLNIYHRHPSYIEELKAQENKKIKSKNALIRCLGLYAYGLELQKTMKMNKEKSEEQRLKNDMSKCTFKPKLNKKISYLDDKIIHTKGVNRLYKNNNLKKFVNKSVDNLKNNNKYNSNEDFEECTFKPKFESDPKACEKLFKNKRKKNKDISEYKGNAEFFLRYTKARDEYLIRRFKKMYRKDDSYDNSLISLTKRLCNKHYRNYLNVNNKIPLFGETISPDNQINSSIVDFRGLSFQNEIPEKKNLKNKNDYIIGLRRNLHSLDLNEEE